VADRDKGVAVKAARAFVEQGFTIAATSGTATHLEGHGVPVATVVAKIGEPTGVDAVDLINSGKVDLVINSPRGRGARADGEHIRAAAGGNKVPCLTTAAAGLAAAEGIADWAHHELRVRSLQEYHEGRDADRPELPL
jgi:carbamoyl-phosphate synthase large subunit